MRIDKYICDCCNISRTQAKEHIKSGVVKINDKQCKKSDIHVEESDIITLKGQRLLYKKYVYIMLNKPENVVCATKDKKDKTVLDLLQEEDKAKNLFIAGRLDKNSTGFVLLTNNGNFAHEILAPKKHVAKHYYVKIDIPVTKQMEQGFAKGIVLVDGTKLKSATLALCKNDKTCAHVVLHQGVFHQIKRMFAVYGAKVLQLHRYCIGNLQLDNTLNPGEYRQISEQELNMIIGNI